MYMIEYLTGVYIEINDVLGCEQNIFVFVLPLDNIKRHIDNDSI